MNNVHESVTYTQYSAALIKASKFASTLVHALFICLVSK